MNSSQAGVSLARPCASWKHSHNFEPCPNLFQAFSEVFRELLNEIFLNCLYSFDFQADTNNLSTYDLFSLEISGA